MEITEDLVRGKLPAIRSFLQKDFSDQRSMMRGDRETIEKALRDGGWREVLGIDSRMSVWAADDARVPILVIICARPDIEIPYTAHTVDLRELNVRGVHDERQERT